MTPAAGDIAASATLRVVAYNVHDLLDDADSVAHVLRSCRPDVACVQEVPRRPFTRHRVRRLAEVSGLRWTAGGRGSGGTAVFTSRRVEVLTSSATALPVAGPFTRTRGFALARVRLPGCPALTVVSVHLPLRADERVRHTAMVLDRLRAADTPYVVAGDLNEPPSGQAWAALRTVLRDAADVLPGTGAPTYPAAAAHRRIDAVLVSPGLGVSRLAVAGAAEHLWPADLRLASDHLPLIADLVLA